MHPVLRSIPLVALALAILLSSGAASAAKAKFERTKPHVNAGTVGHQGVSIPVSNLRGDRGDPAHCAFSGELVATDNTPDRRLPEEIYRCRPFRSDAVDCGAYAGVASCEGR